MAAETYAEITPGSGLKLHGVSRTIGASSVVDEVTLHGEPYLAGYMLSPEANVSTATANSHLLQIMAGASLNVRIRRIIINQIQAATAAAWAAFSVYRLTTAGTGGSAYTPRPFDTADAASGATGMTLPTVKGTEGVQLNYVNAILTQTITATPSATQPILDLDFDRPRSKPLIIPAGTANGIAIKCLAAHAGALVTFQVWLDETSFL